jgi:hypothetical protein
MVASISVQLSSALRAWGDKEELNVPVLHAASNHRLIKAISPSVIVRRGTINPPAERSAFW